MAPVIRICVRLDELGAEKEIIITPCAGCGPESPSFSSRSIIHNLQFRNPKGATKEDFSVTNSVT